MMRGHILGVLGLVLICGLLACVAPALLDHALSKVVITGTR